MKYVSPAERLILACGTISLRAANRTLGIPQLMVLLGTTSTSAFAGIYSNSMLTMQRLPLLVLFLLTGGRSHVLIREPLQSKSMLAEFVLSGYIEKDQTRRFGTSKRKAILTTEAQLIRIPLIMLLNRSHCLHSA